MWWLIILGVGIYLVGAYGAWKLIEKQERANLEKLRDLNSNEAVVKYYNMKHELTLKKEPKHLRLFVFNLFAGLFAVVILWPMVFIITFIWNAVSIKLTLDEYKG